jgi:hypothetical protein
MGGGGHLRIYEEIVFAFCLPYSEILSKIIGETVWELDMACLFCRTQNQLTDEHIFPAFMGGTLVIKDGSCQQCNKSFGRDENEIRSHTVSLLNLLQIGNRYKRVPLAKVEARIRGLDMEQLPASVDGTGKIVLYNFVEKSAELDGNRINKGLFFTKEAADEFCERGKANGGTVVKRDVPSEIVIDASYTLKTGLLGQLPCAN